VLLKKVEELTLHLIQKNDEVKALKQSMKEMNERLEALEGN